LTFHILFIKFEYKDKDIYNKKQIVYEKDFA
jgi:hypothetical protein